MGSFPIYLLFAAIPFWHLRLFEGISVYEMAVVANLFVMPFVQAKTRVRWNSLDVLVFLFAFYGIVTVAISSSTTYESMRIYRYMILGPALLYFIVRVMQPNQRQLAKGMAIFSALVAVQALVVIHYVITHRVRPETGAGWELYQYQGVVASIVTFSVLAVMAASASFFLAWRARGVKRYALLLIWFVCTAGLLASATRASAFGFVLLFPLSGWFLRRAFRRKLLVTTGYLVIIGVMLSIAFMFVSGPNIALGGGGTNQNAIERVVNIDEYKSDIMGRVAFWVGLVRQGSSSAIFGKGMASFDIGTSGGTSFHVGSAHNVLVSTFYTSGLIGLLIILLLWRAAFRGIYQLNLDVPEERWRARFLMVSIMVLLLVSVTNDLTAGRGNLLLFLLALLNYRSVPNANRAAEKVSAAPLRNLPNRP